MTRVHEVTGVLRRGRSVLSTQKYALCQRRIPSPQTLHIHDRWTYDSTYFAAEAGSLYSLRKQLSEHAR